MVAAIGSVDPMPTRSYKWDAKEAMHAMHATCLGMLLFIDQNVYISSKRTMRGLMLCIKQVVLNAITQLFALGVFAYCQVCLISPFLRWPGFHFSMLTSPWEIEGWKAEQHTLK